MKLHLGCGEKYLNGYTNIDFPESEHNVQSNRRVDVVTDITELSYTDSSIDEIRLHHVFEHFTRPIACALTAAWRSWLKPHGILRIEVPDFCETSLILFDPQASDSAKAVALRHVFGSHEAAWAIHCEGWTIDRMSELLKNFGFEVENIEKNSWRGTHNFEIIARRDANSHSAIDLEQRARRFLTDYLVDSSEGELQLLNVWMDMYCRQFQDCLA